MAFPLTQLNLTAPAGYNITEVFDGKNLGVFKATQNFSCHVNPTGVYVIKATKLTAKESRQSKILMYEQIHVKLYKTLYEILFDRL